MIDLPGYRAGDVLYQGATYVVFRAVEEATSRDVIIKTMQTGAASVLRNSRLRLEHAMTSKIDRRFVVPPIRLFEHRNVPVFVKEDIHGVPLDTLIPVGGMEIGMFLTIAVQLAEALDAVHSAGVMHKDIKPDNIIVDPKSLRTYITDLDIASELESEQASLTDLPELDGSLPYLSPEQTGRMNRSVDYRTDFYSLGVTFYELLTATRPFLSRDPMELVHFHIARQPDAVTTRRSDIPSTLDRIVRKLMAKTAEERYQSAFGLVEDLRRCETEWRVHGVIPTFELARHDSSDRLRIPQKLYGRAAEIRSLIDAFEHASTGDIRYVTVSGYSGIGKTSLINEVQKPMAQRRGFYASGKFDQFQRTVPYSALLQALERLVRQILVGTDELVTLIATHARTAVGAEGKVLTDLLPILESLIGKQPDVEELGGMDAQRRVNDVLIRLIRAIATPAHPLVIVLDDVQWADSATLSVLEFAASARLTSVFVILSYRDNEVQPGHPLLMTLAAIRDVGASHHDLHLQPLDTTHLTALLVDTLGRPGADVVELAVLIQRKTDGNPFFVNQFLHTLVDKGLLRFDKHAGMWTWELASIEEQRITENVVELLTDKLRRLAPETQHLLRVAAVIGAEFDLSLLGTVYGDVRGMANALWEPVQEGLIVLHSAMTMGDILQASDQDLAEATDLMCQFQHDRIQQAAYAMCSEDERVRMHLAIARALRQRQSVDGDDALFAMATHFVNGAALLTDDEERWDVVGIELRAAQAALASAAFTAARSFAATALHLLPATAWSTHASVARAVYGAHAEADYTCGEFAHLEQLCTVLMAHSDTVLERVAVHDLRKRAAFAELRIDDAKRESFAALRELGVQIPSSVSMLHVTRELATTMFRMRGITPEDLAALPPMQNEHWFQAVRITVELASILFTTDPNLFAFLLLKQLAITVEHGNHRYSTSVYIGYGIILALALKRVEQAYRIAKMALSLPEHYNAREVRSKTIFGFAMLLQHRREPIDQTYPLFLEAYSIGVETGAYEDAGMSSVGYVYHALFHGKDLTALEEQTSQYLDAAEQFKQERTAITQRVYLQTIRNLRDEHAPWRLDGALLDHDEAIRLITATGDLTMLSSTLFDVGFCALVNEQYAIAEDHLRRAYALAHSLRSTISEPMFRQYLALVILRDAQSASTSRRRTILRESRGHLRALRAWARDCPANYEHKALLVEAEVCRAEGAYKQAFELYARAARSAAVNQFVSDEGFAYEGAARLHHMLGRVEEGRAAVARARECFQIWGATGKVRLLERRWPDLLEVKRGGTASSTDRSSVTSGPETGHALDFSTLLKAQTALASAIDLRRLLPQLMTIFIENVGAERGCLLLDRDGHWLIEAEADINYPDVQTLQSLSPDGHLSLQMLSTVVRTRQPLVLQNASREPLYAHDAYVMRHQPRSILCAPILRQDQLLGVIYLENNLTDGAFTTERLHVLNVLSVQMGISIENAMLYEDLERKVAERTAELRAVNDALEEEQRKSEELLLNMLPATIVERLKSGETTIAERSSDVTVLFADIVNFTQMSAAIPPERVVEMLNVAFNRFDDLVERHGLEKIKTIGDAYMAVGGVPAARADHVRAVVDLALDMQESIPSLQRQLDMPQFTIRVGIHTGSVVAGVIGRSKFSYDLWGDTVNIAARMESHGTAGMIQVSEEVATVLKSDPPPNTELVERGTVEIKGRGPLRTYYLQRSHTP
jgi:predicted ATPase/class 3 adenylate cyclase/tRNA A-37 threonylcarbamoyl transferase component Bud32